MHASWQIVATANAVALTQRGQPLTLGVVYLDADGVSARVARSYSAPLGRSLIIHNMSMRCRLLRRPAQRARA